MSGVRDDSAKAELWDPSTNTWRATASLNRPRADFAAVALADGRVLVTGGLHRGAPTAGEDPNHACIGQDSVSYSSTYLYDPRTGHETWSRTGLLGTARTDPAIAVLPDGRVLVTGGYYESGMTSLTGDVTLADVGPDFTVPPLATAELFDPATGTWSSTGPMHYARYGAAAATLADGRVLVAGGDTFDSVTRSAALYDPASNSWSTLPPMPEPRAGGATVALPDGSVLLVGGHDNLQGDAACNAPQGLASTLRFVPSR